jgi:hypothetical protein
VAVVKPMIYISLYRNVSVSRLLSLRKLNKLTKLLKILIYIDFIISLLNIIILFLLVSVPLFYNYYAHLMLFYFVLCFDKVLTLFSLSIIIIREPAHFDKEIILFKHY